MELSKDIKGKRNKYLVVDCAAYGDKIHLVEMTLTGLDFTLNDDQYRIVEISPYYNTDLKTMGDIYLLIVVTRDRLNVKYSVGKWKETDTYKSLLRGAKINDLIDKIDDKIDEPF